MPCTDGGVPYPPTREETLDAMAPAMLCAIVRSIGSNCVPVTLDRVLRHADWKEAGVTRKEFEEWWALHMKRDAERRKGEAKIAKEKKLREEALAKLTPAQRKLFAGFKKD